jgi:hypothetical protein
LLRIIAADRSHRPDHGRAFARTQRDAFALAGLHCRVGRLARITAGREFIA